MEEEGVKADFALEDDKIKSVNDDNKKAIMVLGLIVVTVVVLAIVTYLFFYNTSYETYNTEPFQAQPQSAEPVQQDFAFNTENNIDSNAQNIVGMDTFEPMNAPTPTPQIAQESINTPQIAQEPQTAPTPPKEPQIAPLNSPTPRAKQPAITDTITSLKYAIKPNDEDIFTCTNMRNGRWNLNKQCREGTIIAVNRLIEANNELIAIEVSGIVDSNPYAGPSAELKQEGLASFRAREAIRLIMRNFSSVAAFEGPSLQQRNKRGFQVKAYYLQK